VVYITHSTRENIKLSKKNTLPFIHKMKITNIRVLLIFFFFNFIFYNKYYCSKLLYTKSRFTDYLTCLTATVDTSPFLNTLYQFKVRETITLTTISQQLITNYLQEYKICTCLLKKILIHLESNIFANKKVLVFILKCNNTEL
jgi:hypothetical protein